MYCELGLDCLLLRTGGGTSEKPSALSSPFPLGCGYAEDSSTAGHVTRFTCFLPHSVLSQSNFQSTVQFNSNPHSNVPKTNSSTSLSIPQTDSDLRAKPRSNPLRTTIPPLHRSSTLKDLSIVPNLGPSWPAHRIPNSSSRSLIELRIHFAILGLSIRGFLALVWSTFAELS